MKRRRVECLEDADSLFICLECIQDVAVRETLASMKKRKTCSYCKVRAGAVSIRQLAEAVDEPLRDHSKRGEQYPVADADSDRVEYQEAGDWLPHFLSREVGIDYEPAMDLMWTLQEMDPEDPKDGDEPFFTDEGNYLRREGYATEYEWSWEYFVSRVRHERRFFDEHARWFLERILGSENSERARDLAVREGGPEGDIKLIHRARRAESQERCNEILDDPISRLGPPPLDKTLPGRMNPVGIPVFYGALSIDTAIAEVRPSVGSRVVVGTFHVTRKIRLLDLPRLGDHWLGSIFDSGYADALSRQKFLETFHWMISRPVQPSDEPLEYIPTQIVAEYVANVLKFDGILFASAQRGNSESPYGSNVEDEFMNVVLFGDAAVVDRPRSKEQPTERAVDTWDPDPRTARQNPPGLAFQVDSAKPFLMKGVKYDYSEDRRVPIERLYPAPLGLPF